MKKHEELTTEAANSGNPPDDDEESVLHNCLQACKYVIQAMVRKKQDRLEPLWRTKLYPMLKYESRQLYAFEPTLDCILMILQNEPLQVGEDGKKFIPNEMWAVYA